MPAPLEQRLAARGTARFARCRVILLPRLQALAAPRNDPGTMARKPQPGRIATNRRAYRNFEILEELDAGLSLLGWEVKALRANRASLVEAYVAIREREAWLVGANFSPLPTASAHPAPVADRSRKLLMHRNQLDRLAGKVEQRGLTLVPLSLYWGGPKAKLRIGLGRGRKQYDKRRLDQERDWQREKQRLARHKAQGRS